MVPVEELSMMANQMIKKFEAGNTLTSKEITLASNYFPEKSYRRRWKNILERIIVQI